MIGLLDSLTVKTSVPYLRSLTSSKFRSHEHVFEEFFTFKGYEWWLLENMP